MLRIAFIGAGQMARHHVQALARSGRDVSIVGVHDRAAGRADGLAGLARCRAFPSIDALMNTAGPSVVHVCTPPEAHFDAARAALEGGAHVYVEKPFARTVGDARALLELAASKRLIVCAGHQLLRDPAFARLETAVPRLGPLVQVDSHFAFQPARLAVDRSSPAALSRELIDVLPHPLYALVAMLERFGEGAAIALEWAHADATEVHAILRAGRVTGRLSVTLRGRPVASTLTATGTNGSLTADFVRSIVVGAGNAGTVALEKVLNPLVEGTQLAARTIGSVAARVRTGISYPGLAESIAAFHDAVAADRPSPLSPEHLLSVTAVFEKLTTRIDRAVRQAGTGHRRHVKPRPHRVTVVTGARGFLGARIAERLPHVRGLGRATAAADGCIEEWVAADLSAGLAAEALRNTDVVVHAAAETAGGFGEHQRNTIDATDRLLTAMHDAGVGRLVLVSSLSVLRPPTPWERQDERAPLASDPERYGPYTWGKTKQEQLVARRASELGIATRIVRPGALFDWRAPELPGLVGKRLFGSWHLGLGRPSLPAAAIDVDLCADAITWCVTHFDQAPPVVNLVDDRLSTRRQLLNAFRRHGWTGRTIWVPIPLLALGVTAARTLLALAHGRRPERLDVWSVLRPRRYDTRVSTGLLARIRAADAALGDSREAAVTVAV
jgi:predicted dehydrogenase/nucleoside-diphosphate-sugar epimerase